MSLGICGFFSSGYYCPSGTQYATQYRCPRGTFSNYTGLQTASDCQPCPGGYYCDQEAQTSYFKICDAGYAYCDDNLSLNNEKYNIKFTTGRFFLIQYYSIYYGYIINVMLVTIFLEQLVEVMVYSCCQKAVFQQNYLHMKTMHHILVYKYFLTALCSLILR